MIELKEVSKIYQNGETKIHAVDRVSVCIPDHKFTVITGKSGSGKTTLMNLMAGLMRPDEGEILCDGKNICGYNRNQLALYRRNTVGIVFQFFRLIPVLNCSDNIWIANEFAEKADKNYFKRLVDQLGISSIMKKYPDELSGGQMQRVAIARALINRPRYLLADEPTGNLDTDTGKQVVELLRSAIDEFESSLIVVTHDPEIASGADVQIQLRDGRVIS